MQCPQWLLKDEYGLGALRFWDFGYIERQVQSMAFAVCLSAGGPQTWAHESTGINEEGSRRFPIGWEIAAFYCLLIFWVILTSMSPHRHSLLPGGGSVVCCGSIPGSSMWEKSGKCWSTVCSGFCFSGLFSDFFYIAWIVLMRSLCFATFSRKRFLISLPWTQCYQ